MIETLRLAAGDGVALEAQLAWPVDDPRSGVVLCHPHPHFGGTMHSPLVAELFAGLSLAGHATLRFNFRGVGASTGRSTAGIDEPADVACALAALEDRIAPTVPLWLVGWSFGADMALSVVDPRVAGWVAIAAPLQHGDARTATRSDGRPKHFVLAAHDEIHSPDVVRDALDGWDATSVSVVAGASHSFLGRADVVISETRAAIEREGPPPP